MAENSNTSRNQKQEQSFAPGPLTEQEIESLRKDKKDALKRIHELWAMEHGNPTDNKQGV